MDQGGACVAALLAEKLFSVGGCWGERQSAFFRDMSPERLPLLQMGHTHSHTGSAKWPRCEGVEGAGDLEGRGKGRAVE